MDADRAYGLLLGLAVGDALGAPVEFEPPAAIRDSGGRSRWTTMLTPSEPSLALSPERCGEHPLSPTR